MLYEKSSCDGLILIPASYIRALYSHNHCTSLRRLELKKELLIIFINNLEFIGTICPLIHASNLLCEEHVVSEVIIAIEQTYS